MSVVKPIAVKGIFSVRTFAYRVPRFSARFPVDLLVGEIRLEGYSRDISEAGMRAVFPQGLPIGTTGVLTVGRAVSSIELQARVVASSAQQMVLRFVFCSEAERSTLRGFVLALAR